MLPLLARKQLASNAQRKTHTVPNADTTRRLTRYPPPVPCWGAGWRHVHCGWQDSLGIKYGPGKDSERGYICVSFQENLDSLLKDGRTSCVIGLKGLTGALVMSDLTLLFQYRSEEWLSQF